MNLYFRSDTLALIQSPDFRQGLTRVDVVRGDTPELRVQFVRMTDGVIVDPFGADYIWLFAAKPVNTFDGTPLVAANTVTREVVGEGEDAVVTYVFTPSLNTEGLNTALGIGEAADVGYVDLNAQFEASTEGERTSTQRFLMRVNNDVAREDDLIPDPLPEGGGGGGGTSDFTLKSSGFSATAGGCYLVDTTSAALTATLPASPTLGQRILFADARGTWDTEPLTIARNGKLIDGFAVNFIAATSGMYFEIVFVDNTTGWRILTSGTQPLNITVPVLSGDYSFSATTGTWTGSPTSYAYQWQISDDGETGWTNITDEAASSYLAAEADEGKFVRCGVIASNANGPSARVFTAASADIVVPDFPTTGMIAFWKLDDLADASGNGNTFTNNNGVSFGAGKIGNAANFGGTENLTVNLSYPTSSADWAISAWIKSAQFTTWGGGSTFLLSQNVAGVFMLFVSPSGNVGINIASDFSPILSAPTTLGTWVHVCAVVEADTLSFYVDGALVGTAMWPGYLDLTQVRINSEFGDQYFSGQVDAVGFWPRALSAGEVAVLYNSGNGLEP